MNIVQRRLKSLKDKREMATKKGVQSHSSLIGQDLEQLAVRLPAPYEKIIGPFMMKRLLTGERFEHWGLTPTATHQQPPRILLSLSLFSIANSGMGWSGIDEATTSCLNFFGSYLGVEPELPPGITLSKTILGLPTTLEAVTAETIKDTNVYVREAVEALIRLDNFLP